MPSIPDPGPAPVLELVRRQSGVVRREQLLATGMSVRTLQRRISSGLWEPRGKRVLVFAGTGDGLLTRSLVAAHAVHPGGVLTGQSALAVRGDLGAEPWTSIAPDPLPWLVSAGHVRVRARVVRGQLPVSDSICGVRVARSDRVLADLVRLLPADQALGLAFRVAQRGGGPAVTRTLLEDLGQRRNGLGSRQLRDVLAHVATGTHSRAEDQLLTRVKGAGLTGFIVNMRLRLDGRLIVVDMAFPEPKVAVEVDGRAFHSSAERFQSDRARQNLLVAHGWRVLRFTWQDVTLRPDAVIASIAALV